MRMFERTKAKIRLRRICKALGVEPYDEWKQPTGAHDAYKKGDRVLFNGSVYESLIDGNAYSPTAYPAGWKLIE